MAICGVSQTRAQRKPAAVYIISVRGFELFREKNLMKRARHLGVLLIACGYILAAVPFASANQNLQSEAARSDPNDLLRSAQRIFIRTKSVYFKPAALEQALLDRKEFQDWGFVISREELDAELIIEVDRKLFTNRFVYSVIDPKTQRVLLAGKIGSLGGTVEGQISDGFIKRLRRIRPLK
jgi:hypothetical protein